MGEEKKPIEENSEPKVAQKETEVPVVPVASVEAPVEAPVETPAETQAEEAPAVVKHEKSSLSNLMEQMMESHDDLASYITEKAEAP